MTTDLDRLQGEAAGQATGPDAAPLHGHIRSFVHRRSHITPGQKEALDRLMPQWAIAYRPGPLDFSLAFGRSARSEEHTSELQSLMRISYAVFCLKKKTIK